MHITQMEIVNFMGVNCKLDLTAPVNIFLGYNGQGKSAILDAVAWAFCGNLPHRGVKVKKDSAVALSTNGDGGARVSLITSEGQVTRTKANAKVPALPVSALAMDAMLNARQVLRMSPADRQKVFGQLLASPTLANAIKEYCEANGIGDDFFNVIVRDLDEAEKYATGQRALAKSQIKDWMDDGHVAPEPVVTIDGKRVDLASFTCEQIEAKLKQRELDLLNLRKTPEPVDIAELEEELAGIKETLTQTDTKIYEEQRDGYREEKVAREKATKAAKEAAALCQAKTQYISKQIETFSGIKGKGKCPTCCQKIDDNIVDGLLEKLGRDLKSQTAEMGKLDKKATDTWKAWSTTSENLQAANEQVETIKNAILKYQAQAIKLEDKIAEARAMPQNATDLPAQIEELDKACQSIRKLLEAVRHYTAAKFQYETIEEKMEKAVTRRDSADRVCQLLKPTGDLRKLAMESQIEVQYDSELVKAWGFESLKILADGTIELFNRPVELASESEQYRVGVILTELLSRESKTNMLLLDGMDLLADTRKDLRERLYSWTDIYDRILVNAAVLAAPTALPPVTGVTYWWVEGGQVTPFQGAG